MKIVLPVHHFPPDYASGAELYTFNLARQLIQRGHEVEVVCIRTIEQGQPDRLDVTHDLYEGVPVWRLGFDLLRAPQRWVWTYNNNLLGEWFDQYLQRNRPDLAHFQAGYLLGVAPLVAAHQHKVPSVMTLHDYWFLCPRHTLQRSNGQLCNPIPTDPVGCAWCRFAEAPKYQRLDRYSGGLVGRAFRTFGLAEQRALYADRRKQLANAIGLPNVLIAPSRFLADRVRPMVAGPDRVDRLCVSRYGLDLSRFENLPPRNPNSGLKIGFIGQITPHKGVHLLVQAFRQLRPGDGGRRDAHIELHIYGGLEAQPGYVAQLRQMAGDDKRIYFHGRCDNNRVPQVLAGFDVSVVPSTWYENCPLAILEALAASTPVVTSKLGGMAELVHDEVDGLHFLAGNAEDLARQLQRLLDEPYLLTRLQAGAAASPTPRSAEDEMKTLLAIYGELVPFAA